MTADEAAAQLETIARSDDFVGRSSELVDGWSSAGAGIEMIDPILSFIERHPDIDFGSPGPLVHFVERFYGNGYDRKLLDSIQRQPTPLTTRMLNRVVNGARAPAARSALIDAMRAISVHPLADDSTRQAANRFVERAAG